MTTLALMPTRMALPFLLCLFSPPIAQVTLSHLCKHPFSAHLAKQLALIKTLILSIESIPPVVSHHLEQQFSICGSRPLWQNSVTQNIYVAIHTTPAKLQLWSSNKNDFMAQGHHNHTLGSCCSRKVENHWFIKLRGPVPTSLVCPHSLLPLKTALWKQRYSLL